MAIFKRKVADFILRHSIAVTIIILVFFIASLFFVVHVKIDSSPEVFFNKEGKSYLSFQAWKEQFGSDDLIIIAFSDEDIFTEKNLALITDLSEKIEFLDYVDSVQSLTTVNNIIGYENDFIVDRLINDIPSDQATLSQLKIEAISNPLFKKNLVSSDGKTTALIIELEHVLGGEDEYKKEVMEHVIKILKQKNETKFYVSGSIATGYFISLYMQKDLNIFIPIMFAMIILILYVYFRKIRIIVFPLMTIGISLSFSLAVLNLLGYSINNLTTIIPPILMAIAIADSIHFMDESIQRKKKVIALNNVQTEDSFLSDTIAHIFFPCLLTTVTTAVGFFSLTTSNVPPVRALGVVVGLGVFFALLVTFTVLPALIKRFKVLNSEKDNKSGIKHEGEEFFDKYFASFLHAIGNFNEKYKVMIIAGTVVIIFLSFLGIKRIKVETSILEFFRKNSPLYSSTVFIEENLCGVHALNISLKTDKRDYFKNPSALKQIEQITSYLYSVPEVDKVISVNDYIKEINKSFHNEDDQYYAIPESKNLISQYLLLYGSTDLNDYVDPQWQWTTLRIRLKEHSTSKLAVIIKDIQSTLDASFSDFSDVEIVGDTVLEVEANNAVAEGQIKSLSIAMLVIFCMMFIVFRSFSVGFVSILPNILPILINFGIMGWVGIRLDSATSMIAAVGIGIVVDDTIHYLHSFGEELKKTGDYTQSMRNSLAIKGRPIILTSIILFFGFGVVSFSSFVPTSYFGLLSAILMINALLADLIILPCILLYFKPSFR